MNELVPLTRKTNLFRTYSHIDGYFGRTGLSRQQSGSNNQEDTEEHYVSMSRHRQDSSVEMDLRKGSKCKFNK